MAQIFARNFKKLKNALRILGRIFFVLFSFILFSCKTIPVDTHFIVAQDYQWQELTPGVFATQETFASTRYVLLKIDIANEAIFIDTNNIGEKYTAGKLISSHAKKEQAFIAINGTPFDFPYTKLLPIYDLVGVHIKDGKVLSSPNEKYAALCITENKKAIIVNSQNEIQKISNLKTAIGGFWTILENDTIPTFKPFSDSRMAVGVNNDGTNLYILGVEKIKPGGGLTYMDCAKILKNAGATKAMQLDGGGSTALYIKQNNQLSIRSKRPIPNALFIYVSHSDDE